MLYGNEAAAIAQQWQRQIEESLEAGETVWLEVGNSDRLVDQIQALTALYTLADRRSDVTAPGLFVGGDGVAWAAMCMSPAMAADSPISPGMALLYAGADRATYLATLATLPGSASHRQQSLLTGLPGWLLSWLWPGSQPGVTPPWSAMPFVLTTPKAPSAANVASNEVGLAWLALVVVIGLIITALFV